MLFLKGIPQAGDVNLALFDTHGSRMDISMQSDYSIDIQLLPKGMYVLIVTVDGVQHTQKIIKI